VSIHVEISPRRSAGSFQALVLRLAGRQFTSTHWTIEKQRVHFVDCLLAATAAGEDTPVATFDSGLSKVRRRVRERPVIPSGNWLSILVASAVDHPSAIAVPNRDHSLKLFVRCSYLGYPRAKPDIKQPSPGGRRTCKMHMNALDRCQFIKRTKDTTTRVRVHIDRAALEIRTRNEAKPAYT